MSQTDHISFEFVDLLPLKLEPAVIYISIEHLTIVHLCLSGCGERVVNGIGPAEWRLTFDGETISIHPSIGNGALPCNTHYWIRKNQVDWAKPLTAQQTRRSQLSDREDLARHHEAPPALGRFRRTWSWLRAGGRRRH